MATSAANPGNVDLIPVVAVRSLARGARPQVAAVTRRRRRISPEAGRALEMLGHAIEYLSDEFALECMTHKGMAVDGAPPQVMAIELLMARNREIYFACPEVPTLGERLRSLLSFQNG